MALDLNSRIVIAGAGSIGCYLGGRLALAGRNVTLLLRETLAGPMAEHGLRVSGVDQSDQLVPPGSLALATDAGASFAAADIIVITVKCRHTGEMADLIARHAPQKLVIVSAQNGVDNVPLLHERLGQDREVVAAMIPFNVVQTRNDGEPPHFHRATAGTVQIADRVPGLAGLLDVPGASVAEHGDMDAVLWGKLLINLNNALNALSGLPLKQELGDRRWRMLLAKQMHEAFPVLRAAGIKVAPVETMPLRLIALALRLPDWLFKRAAHKMLAMDASARSSMWEDLKLGRPTEIDCIQGAVMRQAEALGLDVPLTRRVLQLIRDAERASSGSPALSPKQVDTGVS